MTLTDKARQQSRKPKGEKNVIDSKMETKELASFMYKTGMGTNSVKKNPRCRNNIISRVISQK